MAEIDLRTLPENEIVLHFGGRPNEVDAFTFSNSLVAFAEALQEINRQLSPGTSIEISIEGVGPGSFRAKIAARLKPFVGLWREIGKPVLIGVLTAWIYEKTLGPGDPIIIVNESEVVIQKGHDRIIVPRYIYDARQKISRPQQVEQHIARAFTVLENDPSITDFGLTARIDDSAPAIPIQRDQFALLGVSMPTPSEDGRRHRDERTRITILKAIFQRSHRKWEFVWQGGIRISAPISDEEFYNRLASREFWFAQGDELDVILRVHQRYDDVNKIYINESYEVTQVFQVNHRDRQTVLPILPKH